MLKVKTMKKENCKTTVDEAIENYPGIAVNVADDEKDTEKLVEERTKTLNNNQSDNDL